MTIRKKRIVSKYELTEDFILNPCTLYSLGKAMHWPNGLDYALQILDEAIGYDEKSYSFVKYVVHDKVEGITSDREVVDRMNSALFYFFEEQLFIAKTIDSQFLSTFVWSTIFQISLSSVFSRKTLTLVRNLKFFELSTFPVIRQGLYKALNYYVRFPFDFLFNKKSDLAGVENILFLFNFFCLM